MIWLLLIIGILICISSYALAQSKLDFAFRYCDELVGTFVISSLLTLLIAAIAVFGTLIISYKQIETNLIPISDIYVDNNYDIFVVTDDNGKTHTGKTNKIYKSDNDFLIQYNTNVSDTESFVFGTKKCKYELFLKDTNVPNK